MIGRLDFAQHHGKASMHFVLKSENESFHHELEGQGGVFKQFTRAEGLN